jgi:hypothetical protein
VLGLRPVAHLDSRTKTGTLRPAETTGSAGNHTGQNEQKDSARGNPWSPLKTKNWERKTFLCAKPESDWAHCTWPGSPRQERNLRWRQDQTDCRLKTKHQRQSHKQQSSTKKNWVWNVGLEIKIKSDLLHGTNICCAPENARRNWTIFDELWR